MCFGDSGPMWNRHSRAQFAVPLVAAAGIASLALAAPAQDVPCSVAQATFGSAELACTIEAAPEARDLRFGVRFQGVHDDSLASVAVKIDGQPLACEAGGRQQLQGDAQGDTLTCSLRVPANGAARELRFRLAWEHAEPAGYALQAAAAGQP